MRTKFTKIIVVVGALTAGIVGSASAQIFVNDTFDSYGSQAAFEAAWTPIGTVAPISGTLSTVQAVTGPNSIEILGEAATNGKQRNQRIFSETGIVTPGMILRYSFDFYDSNAAAAPYRQHCNLQDTTAPSGTGQLIAMGLNNNQTVANSGGNFYMARILGFNQTAVPDPDGPAESVGGAGAYFKLNDFGVGLRSIGWHNLRVDITTDDGLSTDFSFFVDGVLAETVNNVGTAANLRSYDNIRLGSGLSNGGNAAYYDNMNLELMAIPEPSTIALGLLGALGCLAGYRRRKA